MFSGFEARLGAMGSLLDKSIRYTRNLTAEISPPVPYELGFLPAVQWLGDEFQSKHGLPVRVKAEGDVRVGEEATRVMLFLAIRELLVNAVKHANGGCVTVEFRAVDVFLTVDRGIRYQQNLEGIGIAVVAMAARSNRLSDLRPLMEEVRAVLGKAPSGVVSVVGN